MVSVGPIRLASLLGEIPVVLVTLGFSSSILFGGLCRAGIAAIQQLDRSGGEAGFELSGLLPLVRF